MRLSACTRCGQLSLRIASCPCLSRAVVLDVPPQRDHSGRALAVFVALCVLWLSYASLAQHDEPDVVVAADVREAWCK